jgi:stage II sporulation protein D
MNGTMTRARSMILFAAACATAVAMSTSPVGAIGSAGVLSGGAPTAAVHLSAASLVASTCPSSGGVKVAEAAAPTQAVKVYGHGWGHGMGMSQYGAQGAARLGCSYRTILGTYYRDSSVLKRSLTAPVVLNLASTASNSSLNAQTGPVTWSGSGRTALQPKGSTWSVVRRTVSGRVGLALLDVAGTQKLFVPNAAVLTAKHAGTVVTIHPTGSSSGLTTRWDSARFIGSAGGIAVTEVIGAGQGYTAVQKYLMGLAEVPVSWPLEALKAQVVAARTYLTSKYSSGTGSYVVRTTSADQVYGGFTQEKKDADLGGNWRKAVVATDGQVIVDGSGRVIEAMYSSSMGGHTEDRQYVYGSYGISYLKAVDDSRWDNASDNPYRRWSKGFSTADLAKRFGFDSVSSWSVPTRGSALRLGGVKITGKRAGKTVTAVFTGSQAKGKLGIRSTGFTFGAVPAPTTPTRAAATPTSPLSTLRHPTPKQPVAAG